ncbi:MAG: hypothetical protein GY861_12655 [bacterium]|nr:hypothetical protein [bacterium]
MYLTKDYVFFHHNKNAGVTIKDFMIKHMDAKVLKYKHAPCRMLPKKYRDRITIGCVRNPYAFYVSYYHYHTQNGRFRGMSFSDYLKKHIMNPRSLTSLMPPKLRKKFPLLYPPNTKLPIGGWFFHYINFFSYKSLNIFKNWTIDDLRENIEDVYDLDAMWRTETLKGDMIDEFCIINSFPLIEKIKDFPRKNSSKHKPYREYYTPELIELVKKRDGILMNYLEYRYE